jgi:class 3 adenylate cyclase
MSLTRGSVLCRSLPAHRLAMQAQYNDGTVPRCGRCGCRWRIQVSVLFVDICDSTSLLRHADPGKVRDYLGKALDLL